MQLYCGINFCETKPISWETYTQRYRQVGGGDNYNGRLDGPAYHEINEDKSDVGKGNTQKLPTSAFRTDVKVVIF